MSSQSCCTLFWFITNCSRYFTSLPASTYLFGLAILAIGAAAICTGEKITTTLFW
jgi:hypothetical protein